MFSKLEPINITIIMLFIILAVSGQEALADKEKIIFLAHSTGTNLFNQGDVSEWIQSYNSSNGTTYQITRRSYPNTPYTWDNYPYDYWNLWINGQCNSDSTGIECLESLTQDYDVIIFKHCYPGASILPDTGNPSVTSEVKKLENYKLQYRALRDKLDTFPDTKFIIWTLVPRHRLATNSGNAGRAKEFVEWVKNEYLSEDGDPHNNIYIFDFFGIVAESNPTPENGEINCLKYEYELSHTDSDSHPNQAANQYAGPIFAQFIVDSIESNDANHPPEMTQIGDKDVNEGGLLEFEIFATDPDADNLTYRAENLPNGSNFSTPGKTFSWMPGYTESGTYSVLFTVMDDGEPVLEDQEAVSITVNNVTQTGDVDDNGELSLEDLIITLKITGNLYFSNTISRDADVNLDSIIGIEESIYILQKLSLSR